MVLRTTAAIASPPLARRKPERRGAHVGSTPPPKENEKTATSLSSTLLSSRWNRALRFAAVGGATGALQILILVVLEGRGWAALPANAVGFVFSAQVNFVLNSTFTWRDRAGSRPLWRRWALFQGSIASTAVLNQIVFAGAHVFAPSIVASMCGIAGASVGNFVLGDRLVFRRGGATVTAPSPEQAA